MELLRADFANVHGLPAKVAFGTAPSSLTVLQGEQGPLARRIIDLVVAAKERIGPYGVAGPVPWPAERGPATVTVEFALDSEERDFAATEERTLETTCWLGPPRGGGLERHPPGMSALLSRHAADASVGRVERIGAFRSLEGAAPGGSLPSLRKALYLSTHPKKLAGLPQLLLDAARDANPVSDRFQAALARLGAGIDFRGVRMVAGRHELAFSRKRQMEGLFDLGLDEQQLVLFAGFFAALPMSRSILLLEEPELHQGDGGLRALMEGLVALAEGNQLIVTTRSAAVARAIPGAHVVQLGAS